MSPSRVGLGSKKLCVAHDGGPRCTRRDAHVVFDMPPPAYYTVDAVRLCRGCYVALHPDKAKVKVLKEHFVLAELQGICPGICPAKAPGLSRRRQAPRVGMSRAGRLLFAAS